MRVSICTGKRISWPGGEAERAIKLLPGKTYVRPSGYKVRMEKPGANRTWRLVGTVAEGTLCHKPCTVSGGGKSEISKPITDAMLTGPVFVADFKKDFDRVAELLARDYSGRFKRPGAADQRSDPQRRSARSARSSSCSRPTSATTQPEYNAWLATVPQYIKELVFVVKRYYKPEWGEQLARPFQRGHHQRQPGQRAEMRQPQAASPRYLRVGFRRRRLLAHVRPAQGFLSRRQNPDRGRHHRLGRGAARRAQGPARPVTGSCSLKFVQNCEQRLFQRPDDAIHRGYDKQTEADFARPDNFFSNYEPLTGQRTRAKWSRTAIGFYQFTEPMQALIREVAANGDSGYFVCSANPRLVEGKPSKNPRYLQIRPDLLQPARVVSGRNGRAVAPPAAAGPARLQARGRRAARPPQQPAGGRHPLAGGVQPDSLLRTAGAVHGVHLQHDRQVALHHRRRLGRRADQGPVQRAAAHH